MYHCDCLCFVPRLEFDSAVQEMLPNTLLDMKRALYEVSCDWSQYSPLIGPDDEYCGQVSCD